METNIFEKLGAEDLKCFYKTGAYCEGFLPSDNVDHEKLRTKIEPWLTALFQAEHFNVLVGNGFSLGVSKLLDATGTSTAAVDVESEWGPAIEAHARMRAEKLHRLPKAGESAPSQTDAGNPAPKPGMEDVLRSLNTLIDGLEVADNFNGLCQAGNTAASPGAGTSLQICLPKAAAWFQELKAQRDAIIEKFCDSLLNTEGGILDGYHDEANRQYRMPLLSFLLSLASRMAPRERTHVFTTNYDRVIEFGFEELGVRLIDRFEGSLSPIFRQSSLSIDMHYDPPGIRGEPRYLEGVVRYTKLHGSLDWYFEKQARLVRRLPVAFGAPVSQLMAVSPEPFNRMIYPNAAKDIETLEYPYVDLFRDFAAACCRPNSVLAVYGYSFGDDHINRVIRDMMRIPSCHLVIFAFDDKTGMLRRFLADLGRPEQTTLLFGSEFARLDKLTQWYLPKPAIDPYTFKLAKLLENRMGALRRPEEDRDDGKNKKDGNGGAVGTDAGGTAAPANNSTGGAAPTQGRGAAVESSPEEPTAGNEP